MKIAVLAGVAVLIATPCWAEPAKREAEGPAGFRVGCEWSMCALKVNGCKPYRGKTPSERYDDIARKVDACNRGRDNCQCENKGS